MRVSILAFISLFLLIFCSFAVEAGGGGGGGGGSGSSVPFLHPLLNIMLFVVIGFFTWQKKK